MHGGWLCASPVDLANHIIIRHVCQAPGCLYQSWSTLCMGQHLLLHDIQSVDVPRPPHDQAELVEDSENAMQSLDKIPAPGFARIGTAPVNLAKSRPLSIGHAVDLPLLASTENPIANVIDASGTADLTPNVNFGGMYASSPVSSTPGGRVQGTTAFTVEDNSLANVSATPIGPPGRNMAIGVAPGRVDCPRGCGKSYGRKCDADRHAKSHDVRDIACRAESCGKMFYRRDKMEDHHRKTHSG